MNCYVGLGRYDWVVFGEYKDFEPISEYRRHRLRHILDWHVVCGSKWKFSSGNYKCKQKPVLGTCLIKLDPYALPSISPTLLEESIVKKIIDLQNRVYCSLGNYEIVCQVPADDFCKLSQKIQQIKRILVQDETPVSLEVTTIPSFSPAILSEKGFADLRKSEFPFSLLLSLRLGYNKALGKELEKLFPNSTIASRYGFHDISVRLTCSFSDFVKNVLKLRRKARKFGIYSTCVAIEEFQEPFPFSLPRTHFKVSTRTRKRKEALAHFRNLIDISMLDPLTRVNFRKHEQLFKDVDKLVKKALRFKRKKRMIEYWGFVEKYDTFSDCLRLVLSQRYTGLIPGNLLSHKTLGLEPQGGIQRVILAIESIPVSIFRLLGIKWSGFCLFGYSHRFFRTECGLINIPEAYRLHPEMWWGLFHELGHEALAELKDPAIAGFAKRTIYRIADEAYERSRKRPSDKVRKKAIIYDFTDFVEEIFAELFGFYFGFRNDWALYKEKVWNYFARELPINSKHIARAILAFFNTGPGYELREGGPIGGDEIMKYVDELEQIFISQGRKGWTLREKVKAIDLVINFDSVADKFAEYLERFKLNPLASTAIQNINSDLRKGRIIRGIDPAAAVFALMKDKKPMSTEKRVATITTLYDSYWKLMRVGK